MGHAEDLVQVEHRFDSDYLSLEDCWFRYPTVFAYEIFNLHCIPSRARLIYQFSDDVGRYWPVAE